MMAQARPMVAEAASRYGIAVEIVNRNPRSCGFVVVPRRWVVELTFGWLGRSRRPRKDYEYLTDSSEAWIHLARTQLMLR